jgi:hypothetical protein
MFFRLDYSLKKWVTKVEKMNKIKRKHMMRCFQTIVSNSGNCLILQMTGSGSSETANCYLCRKISEMVKKALAVVVLIFVCMVSKGQVNASDSAVSAFIPYAAYAYQIPGGDIADRYGHNSTIGGGFFYKSKKNLLFSLDFNFIFGSDIKHADSILRLVETSSGHIIDGNGTYALYTLYERGYSINFRVGKIFKVLRANPNSGLMLMVGAGYLAHRMVIDNQNNTAPQIGGDYARGYDRLTAGLNLNQFIGYFYMGKSRVFNFYGGFEFYQAFTSSQRDYVFDQMRKDDNNYTDLFFGIKIGWMIPIYKQAPDPYYYH